MSQKNPQSEMKSWWAKDLCRTRKCCFCLQIHCNNMLKIFYIIWEPSFLKRGS